MSEPAIAVGVSTNAEAAVCLARLHGAGSWIGPARIVRIVKDAKRAGDVIVRTVRSSKIRLPRKAGLDMTYGPIREVIEDRPQRRSGEDGASGRDCDS